MQLEHKYDFSNIVNEQHYRCLTEADFYPPVDNRSVKSNVRDIAGGDNFADYCKDMFNLLEEEGYYE
jgi:hypothetical protein